MSYTINNEPFTQWTSKGDIPTGRVGLCEHCGEAVAEVKDPTSGCYDLYSNGGDYGCPDSPDTNDEGTGSHYLSADTWGGGR